MDISKYLLKEPFKEPIPQKTSYINRVDNGKKRSVKPSKMQYRILSQEDFMCEYYPSGHKIYDRPDYVDKMVSQPTGSFDADGNEITRTAPYIMQRRAVNLQQVIVNERLASLTGYPINFMDSDSKPNEKRKELLAKYKQEWINHNMEIAIFKFIESYLVTGDAATYIYMLDGKPCFRTFSFLNGDVLIPQYDAFGNIVSVTRYYTTSYINVSTKTLVTDSVVDIIDDTYYSTYTTSGDVIRKEEHGMGMLPIVYGRRDEGAIWTGVRHLINDYEYLLSVLAESNRRLAFQKLLIKTDGDLEVQAGDDGGDIIKMDANGNANFLGKTDVSNSFTIEMEALYDNILRGCGIVKSLDSSQGDQPSTTSKLRYAPSTNFAMREAKNLDSCIDAFVVLFKKCMGHMEGNRATDYEALQIIGKIDIYTVIDENEYQTMINNALNWGVISKETARELSPLAKPDENERCKREEKELLENEEKTEKSLEL